MKKLLIIGAGGHGRVVADIASHCGYRDIAFLDDATVNTMVAGHYPVIGALCDAAAYVEEAVFLVAIGHNPTRAVVTAQLEAVGATLISLVHPGAIVADDVACGNGTVVMAGAVINTGAVLEDGVIINTSSSVDHDCVVKRFAHISVGAHLAGTVSVGEGVLIGAGATVINNLHIAADTVVGAGACVIRSIDKPGTYVGVPAARIS